VVDEENGYVLAESVPFLYFKGIAESGSAKGNLVNINVFYKIGDSVGSEGVDTGVQLAALNEFGNIEAGATVECRWDYDMAGNYWRVVQAECNP
jgi:hypothetical protein